MEILAKNIAEDILKIGVAIDGLWFDRVEDDITNLLAELGFVRRIICGSKEVGVVAYEKGETGIIHIIIYMSSGDVWQSSRFLGYGAEAAGTLEKLRSFYREKLKFSVE